MEKNLITINNCRIDSSKATVVPEISWNFTTGQAWLVIGPNGGGKADFLNAISKATDLKFVPNNDTQNDGLYSSIFGNSVEIVSLERAAKLIQEERENDESDYVEGGVDFGRTGRVFITESVIGTVKKNSTLPEFAKTLDDNEAVKLCGIQGILDRGLKYMSTGEIRRTLLARALISKKKLLILSDPFAGLDIQSRGILLDFFNSIANRQINSADESKGTDLRAFPGTFQRNFPGTDCKAFPGTDCKAFPGTDPSIASNASDEEDTFPRIILGMERWHEIPDAITNVIEFRNKEVSFCGTRADYEKLLKKRTAESKSTKEENEKAFSAAFAQTLKETEVTRDSTNVEPEGHSEGISPGQTVSLSRGQAESLSRGQTVSLSRGQTPKEILVQMNDVNVGWGDHKVLKNLNWTLNKDEHWLVRGPNGSGKTTFLELITGDNQQVYCNDIYMFGRKRGTGETIWDIKKELGIVSYRMHVEYRMLGGTSLLNVIVSGFRDSIGLYGAATDVEAAAAKKWLALGGFQGRENTNFGELSYGEQRAILILRSAVKSPKILILDEPCHGLDETFRDQILQLIQLIAEQGTTTILHVTHDPSEVLPCEKHILELHPNEDPMYKIIENN